MRLRRPALLSQLRRKRFPLLLRARNVRQAVVVAIAAASVTIAAVIADAVEAAAMAVVVNISVRRARRMGDVMKLPGTRVAAEAAVVAVAVLAVEMQSIRARAVREARQAAHAASVRTVETAVAVNAAAVSLRTTTLVNAASGILLATPMRQPALAMSKAAAAAIAATTAREIGHVVAAIAIANVHRQRVLRMLLPALRSRGKSHRLTQH